MVHGKALELHLGKHNFRATAIAGQVRTLADIVEEERNFPAV